MSETVTIDVAWPGRAEALRLRTDDDWEVDRAPSEPVAPGADVATFRVVLDRPFKEFKPLLLDPTGPLWAAGDNLFVVSGETHVRVFPRFDGATHCGECTEKHVASAFEADGLRVRVFEPDGYREHPERRWPVIYMQDGQNLFFADESFLGETWQVQETVRSLARMALIEPALVVGIKANDREARYTSPGYASYGRALVEELKPWVDENYRTLAGPSHTAVMGSSLGGVVSLYLAWQHPETFGSAACLSSTFGFKDDLLDRVAREPKRPVRLYLDSGWPRDNYEVTLAMRNRLIAAGYRLGDDLVHFAFPGARHGESAWATRLHMPFQYLLGPAWNPEIRGETPYRARAPRIERRDPRPSRPARTKEAR